MSCKRGNTAALLFNKVDVWAGPLENSCVSQVASVDILKGEEHFKDTMLSKFGSM